MAVEGSFLQGTLFFLDTMLFILLRSKWKYKNSVTIPVVFASIVLTLAMMYFTEPSGIWVMFYPVPAFILLLLISADRPFATAYLFFDGNNLAYAVAVMRSIIYYFAGDINAGSTAISCIIVAVFLYVIVRRRQKSRRLMEFLSRSKTPFFLFPLSLMFLSRVVLAFNHDGSVGAGIIGMTLMVVVLVNSYLMSAMVLQEEKAAKAEVMAGEMQLMKNVVHALNEEVDSFEAGLEKTETLRHDMRHHNNVLYGFLQDGKTQNALGYLTEIQDELDSVQQKIYCENDTINAVLSIYIEKAEAQGITVKHKIYVPKNIGMDEMELASLYANTIENATEGCVRAHAENGGNIRIYADYKDGRHFLEVENTCEDFLRVDGEQLPPSKKKGGGVGSRSVQHIVEKYGGMLEYTAAKGVFRARIIVGSGMMPAPEI